MTWGAFWMYYKCPHCKRTFKNQLANITDSDFGHCTLCGILAEFVGESGKEPEGDLSVYVEE